jgi:hypothetical protein
VSILKVGSLCRVNLPTYEGKLALGVVQSFQVFYSADQPPYCMAWVDMLIEGRERPFSLENLEVVPRALAGSDQGLVFEIIKEAA